MRITLLIGLLAVCHSAHAEPSVKERCWAVGGIVTDAAVSRALKVAFDEDVEWRGFEYEALQEADKQLVQKYIEHLHPQAEAIANKTMLKIPEWNKFANGREMARTVIIKGLGASREDIAIQCLRASR